MNIKHANLFSGIGGFLLAAEWCGWENIFAVEIEDYPQKVLQKNFPNIQKFKDIYDFDGTKFKGTVDIISGGFPCQPFSVAGKRQGEKDNRYLWPEMLRVISEIKPAFVVGENVVGLVSMENGKILERIFSDLENEGYTVESFIIPACGVGAWHRRNRIWIIAYSRLFGQEKHEKQTAGIEQYSQTASNTESINKRGLSKRKKKEKSRFAFNSQNVSNSNNTKTTRQRKDSRKIYGKSESERFNPISKDWWAAESGICRVVDDVPEKLDKNIKENEKNEKNPNKALQKMQQRINKEKNKWKDGGQGYFYEKEILRQSLYGSIPNEKQSNIFSDIEKSSEIQKTKLRKMWEQSQFEYTSYRRGLDEQFDRKLNNIVCKLSYKNTLGKWKEITEETIGLYNLWTTCEEIGYVPKTLSEVQKIWKSLTYEEMEWIIIRIGIGNRCWAEWVGTPRVAKGIKNRVDRLKCLGNTVVVPLVYEIFKAINKYYEYHISN